MEGTPVEGYEWKTWKGDNTIKVIRTNPYGHMYFKMDVGVVPDMLKGAYTSFREIETSIKKYLDSKPQAPSTAKEDGPPPPPKTKSVGPKAKAKAEKAKEGIFE